MDDPMNESAQKLVAELLARRLGVNCSDLEPALSDPVAAIVALSMMGQTPPEEHGVEPAERLARIATTVGACPLCLGEDLGCIECWGEGRPGSRVPERAALLRWIAPPLRRLRLGVTPLHDTRPEQKRGDHP
jgi:hypothetical protein